MSESENLDLSALDLMPSWVTDLEKPSAHHREHESDAEKPRGQEGRRRDDFRGGDRDDPRGRLRHDRDRDRGVRGPDRDRDGRGQLEHRDRDRQGRGEFRGRDRDRDGNRGRDGNRDGNRGRDRDRWGRGEHRDRDRPDAPKPADPIPPVEVSLVPAPFAVDALARHIRSTGRAYPMVDVAKMILGGRDRYRIEFQLKAPEKDALYLCEADGSLWVSKEEAIQHVLNSSVLRQYYDIEEVDLEPPRGNYTVVAVCGWSGRILGPPNHHQYQQNLVHLHRERYSDMPLERYKSRIEMRRDEETIEKWKQQVSKTFHYRVRTGEAETPAEPAPEAAEISGEPASETADIPPTEAETPADPATVGADEIAEDSPGETPAETPSETEAAEAAEPEAESEAESEAASAGDLGKTETDSICLENKEALARHFREHFADKVIKAVSEASVPGDIPGKNLSRGLLNSLRNESELHRRGFPLTLIQLLCGEFEKLGLRFFKRGRKSLYVSMTRPRPILDEEAFTDRVRQIVDFVRSHPRANVVDLLNALVTDYPKTGTSETFQEHQLTPAERDVLADLKWLTTEGYLIEYPDTELMLGRQESPSQPRPPSPAKKKGAAGTPKKKAPETSASPESAGESGQAAPGPASATTDDEPGAEESAGDPEAASGEPINDPAEAETETETEAATLRGDDEKAKA